MNKNNEDDVFMFDIGDEPIKDSSHKEEKKPSGLSKFNKASIKSPSTKYKDALAQFLRDTMPVQNAFIERFNTIDELFENSDTLERMMTKSLSLANNIIKKLTENQKPDQYMVRAVLESCAGFVASNWLKEQDYNEEKVVSQLVNGFNLASPERDVNQFKNIKTSMDASVAMTSMSAMIKIMDKIIEYDFDIDKRHIMYNLSKALEEMVSDAVYQVLPEESSIEDRLSTMQDFTNHYSRHLALCYEQHAIRTSLKLERMSDYEKGEFHKIHDPIDEIINATKTHSKYWVGCAVAFGRKMTKNTLNPPVR